MTTKVTFLFEQASATSQPNAPRHRVGGWSETWYSNFSPSIVPDKAAQFMAARAPLLPTGCSIVGQRYQQVDPVGPSQSTAVVIPGSSGLASDAPQMALLCRVPSGTTRNIRQMILRGLPDARSVEGEFDPSQAFTRALNAFFVALGSWRFKGRDLDQTAYPLLTIGTTGQFQTEAASTLAVGDMVRILKATDQNGDFFGGRFKIGTKTFPDTGTLLNWPATVSCTKGKIRKDLVVYPAVDGTAISISRTVIKKVGRSFSGYRGRQSTPR